MTTTVVNSSGRPRRTEKLRKKFVFGYLPCTGLVIAPPWAWVVVKSASGPGAAAGALILAVWSAQICVSNLLIFFFRFTSSGKFLVKAVLTTVFSIALLPSIFYVKHHVDLLTMGKPHLAEYLRQSVGDDCAVAQVLKDNRINDRVRTIEARVQCGGATVSRTCEWYFEYQNERRAWVLPYPAVCK